MMKQKDAVYAAVCGVLGSDSFDGSAVEIKGEQRASVVDVVCEGFKAGKVSYDGALPEDKELRKYVIGLVNNWLRKDVRLNGGTKYTPKNPGSRAGSADAQVVALRTLMANTSDEADKAEIQGHINKRLAEIKPASSAAKKELSPEQIEQLKALGLEHLI